MELFGNAASNRLDLKTEEKSDFFFLSITELLQSSEGHFSIPKSILRRHHVSGFLSPVVV